MTTTIRPAVAALARVPAASSLAPKLASPRALVYPDPGADLDDDDGTGDDDGHEQELAPAARALAQDAAKIGALLPDMLKSLGGVDDLRELGVRPLVASAGKDSLFNCLFGRDSIRMATDLIDSYPAVAKATIVELAKLQGVKVNAKAEEEPGRIIHEYRSADELDKMMEFNANIANWDFPYYGSVDSTPGFVNLVAAYVERHGPAILDETFVDKAKDTRTIRRSVEAAVSFIEGRLDDTKKAGGYLYVQRANPDGIENQILEDSRDSLYYDDGKLHPTTLPYAPVAEQGYAYHALMSAAVLGVGDVDKHRSDALALQRRFLRDFWQPDLGTFAQAIGYDDSGRGQPMRTVASSPGQLFATGILDDAPELRRQLADRLFQPDMLAGAGIRTKSTGAARFLAGGYHNGTVWPTISLEIADGLRRYANDAGFLDKAIDLEDRSIRAMAKFAFFPEFLRGDVDGSIRVNEELVRKLDRDGIENTLEQPPQPQGWTATAMEKVLRRRGFLAGDAGLSSKTRARRARAKLRAARLDQKREEQGVDAAVAAVVVGRAGDTDAVTAPDASVSSVRTSATRKRRSGTSRLAA